MSEITFERLRAAVGGDAVAIRSRLMLQPAGGEGDKVFPPSYSVDRSAEHKYAVEKAADWHHRQGLHYRVVGLCRVPSESGRVCAARRLGARRELAFPVPFVDFSQANGLTDYEKLTVLEAPHRLADAIFRDSLLGDTLFRLSDIGRAIIDATPRNATALFRYSPTSLLFGMWDSTGPKGGLGAKFQRAYVSEIVGFDAAFGKKVGSRIDPLQIEKVAPEDRVFNSADPDRGLDACLESRRTGCQGQSRARLARRRKWRAWAALQDQPWQHRALDRRSSRRCHDLQSPSDNDYFTRGVAPPPLSRL